MHRRLLRRFFRVTLRLVAVFIVVELILRTGLWPIVPQRTTEPDPITGWRVRPNLQFAFQSDEGPYLLETNSLGLRGGEHSKEKDDGVYRIVAQGACGTFGLGVAEQDCYVSKLEDFLPNTETVNLGNIGFSATQQFVQLTDEALQYHPDLIIQFFIKDDDYSTFCPWVAGMGWKPYLVFENNQASVRTPSPTWLLRAVEKTHLPLLASRNEHLFEPLFAEEIPSEKERFLAMAMILLKTKEICNQAGADYLPVFVPTPEYLQVYETRGPEAYTLIPRLFDYLHKEKYLAPLNLMDPLLHAMNSKSDPAPFSSEGRSLIKYGHEVVARSVADVVKLMPKYQAQNSRTHAQSPNRGTAGSRS